jgi:AcrR family transcriptional regulator
MTPQPPAVSAAAPAIRIPGSRRPLDREFILTGALDIIDTHGAEALTMRALAAHLESGTTTLYRHFPNRVALIAAVIDRVISEVDVSDTAPTTGTWQQICKSLAQRLFDAFAAHSNLASLLVENPPIGQATEARRELVLAVLLRDGFTPATAGRLYATMSHYVRGFAIQLSAHSDNQQPQVATPVTLADADPTRFPATAAAAASGALPMTLAEEFTYGLDLILGIDRLDDHRQQNP